MKTSFTNLAATALALATTAQAHMELTYPPPYRSKHNTNAGQNIDYSMTAPLSGAAQFPCKGYHSDFGTPAGASVATWAAGSSEKFTVEGGAPHGGGSCQASLSYDKGATFKVIASFVGSCPLASGDSFDFTVPSDAPSGEAIFAWTWFNKIGNREIYMNCATVTISGSKKRQLSDRGTAFSSRPEIFQANLGNGCTTVEGKEVIFPNPGPDVVDKQTGNNEGALSGNCGASSGGSSGGSGGSPPAPAPSSPAAAPPGGVFVTVAPSPSASSTPPAAAAPVATPTTMATIASPDPTPVATQAPAPSAPAASPPTKPAPSTGSGSTAAGSACSPEGQWNCIGGTSYQQCASGTWSVVMQLAAGTKCTVGQSSVIDITAAKRRNIFA